MLKQIPKSDINLRPFKVYKHWQGLTEGNFSASAAVNHISSSSNLNDIELSENGLYHQLKTMYYNGDNALNPFLSFGDFKPRYTTYTDAKQRVIHDRALVLKIPQTKFGEGIKKNSIELELIGTGENIVDDGFSNLISDRNTYELLEFNVQEEKIVFLDVERTSYTLNLWAIESGYNIDMNTGIIYFEDEGNLPFTNLVVDIENKTLTFTGLIASLSELVLPNVGNVFYSHGIITLTKETELGAERENAFSGSNFDGFYKSTITIYENEFLLVVGEDEFNTSTNPSSYTETNIETGSINTTFEGVKKFRNSDKYQKNDYYSEHTFLSGSYVPVLGGYITSSVTLSGWGGFNSYEYSSSIDPTGSYLAPYITTIGLYDNNMDMVAVAKLATPVKSMPDLPVNFLVRIDT